MQSTLSDFLLFYRYKELEKLCILISFLWTQRTKRIFRFWIKYKVYFLGFWFLDWFLDCPNQGFKMKKANRVLPVASLCEEYLLINSFFGLLFGLDNILGKTHTSTLTKLNFDI